MKIFENIKQWFATQNKKEKPPEGICPNCWGRQEYGSQFYEAVYKEKIDLENIDQKKGWIDAYAVKHFQGIILSNEGNTKQCPSCKLTYS